jgi:hypothetical protein
MRLEVKSITAATTELIRKSVWTVKQAHEQLVDIYKLAFADCCGKNWQNQFTEWENFEEVVDAVESMIQSVCVDAGMPRSVWSRYKKGCRNCCFFGIPFTFRTVSTKDILTAKAMAAAYEDGTQEKRITKALGELRREKQSEYVANSAARSGMAVLRLPREGEDACAYSDEILRRILSFLERDEVRTVLESQNALGLLKKQVETALRPKKRSAA